MEVIIFIISVIALIFIVKKIRIKNKAKEVRTIIIPQVIANSVALNVPVNFAENILKQEFENLLPFLEGAAQALLTPPKASYITNESMEALTINELAKELTHLVVNEYNLLNKAA